MKSYALALLLTVACHGIAQAPNKAVEALETLQQAEAKVQAQDWPQAVTLFEKTLAINPTEGSTWRRLAFAAYSGKMYDKAIAANKKAMELGADYPFAPAYDVACCYALMGDKAKALDWLEKSLDEGFRDLKHLQTDSDLESLHSDPRFIKLAALEDVSKMSRDEAWRYDLWLLARELKRIHYAPFAHISEKDFDTYVTTLHDEVPKLTDNEITTRLMMLTRRMADGHTGIRPAPGSLKTLPIQFYFFDNDLYITASSAAKSDLLGAKVLKFGDKTVDETMAALDRIVSRDNSIWVKQMSPMYLRQPAILNGLGIVPSANKLTLTIKDAKGQERTVEIEADTSQPDATWALLRRSSGTPDPLYQKNRNAAYWYEYLPDQKLVYFQYNAVVNDPKDPLPTFCDKLFKFIDDNPVDRLVIDMRWNGGGNLFLNSPLIQGLIKNQKINQQGKLFVIIGRGTYSAAQSGITLIERFANPIFVGEPSGSSPNFVGESIRIALPYSKMQGAISDLYWQNSVAMDFRTWIAPQLYAPPTFDLFKANRDPAMEAIAAYKK